MVDDGFLFLFFVLFLFGFLFGFLGVGGWWVVDFFVRVCLTNVAVAYRRESISDAWKWLRLDYQRIARFAWNLGSKRLANTLGISSPVSITW